MRIRTLRQGATPPLLLAGIVALTIASTAGAGGWSFTEVSGPAGVAFIHGDGLGQSGPQHMGGGAAAADFDGDGWLDLYAVGGRNGANKLFRNLGNGTFEDVAAAAGVALTALSCSGPLFVDLDDDGWLDLVMGEILGGAPTVFRNRGDATFEDVSAVSNLPGYRVLSTAAGDFDRDGRLDLAFSQWNPFSAVGHLWRNEGGFVFSDVSTAAFDQDLDKILRTFTPNFTDLDGDGWSDLTWTNDFDNSQALLNDGDGTFAAIDDAVLIDKNGMGAAHGDYDNDGDLDWFVSSIWDPLHPKDVGNRLYRNRGDGTFDDVTEAAGVRIGYWGWGACFADLDNDGDLDLFHTNGWRSGFFWTDPSRLFVNNGDGTFTEQAAALGIDDTGLGRGVVCFDYDGDGDVDLYVANNDGPSRLYRNDGGNAGAFLQVRLRGGGNSHGIGGHITLLAGGLRQVREIRAGSNYVSQNPPLAHFGLGTETRVERLEIRWPDGRSSALGGLAANQSLTVESSTLFSDGFETGDLAAWSGQP